MSREGRVYFRIKMYIASPRTILVMCRKDPVSAMRSPPNDAYAVLGGAEDQPHADEVKTGWAHTISALPPSNLYTCWESEWCQLPVTSATAAGPRGQLRLRRAEYHTERREPVWMDGHRTFPYITYS